MKKIWKIMLAAACIIILSALVVLAVSANSTGTTGAQLSTVNVSSGGDVKMHFVYSTLGDAEKVVVNVAGETTEIPASEIPEDENGKYVVSVPLSPAQMADSVTVYAVDAQGNVSGKKEYSVREYALGVLADPAYQEYHASMRGLLNWGAMASAYFNDKSGANDINEGLFSGGTNPVTGLSPFFKGEVGKVSDGSNIAVAGYQVFLEEGNTILRAYFTYEGELADLEATIAKDGKVVAQGAQAPIRADEEVANRYYVNINNVGVAVFDKEYTVTLSAGDDSASMTKTVLEYLNTIAFDTELNFSESQRNLAKSMYQFYVQARDVQIADCAHAGTYKMKDTGSLCERVYCADCFKSVGVIDHDIVNGRCTVCGKTEYSEDDSWDGPAIGGENVPNMPGIGSLSSYNLDAYMSPMWDSELIHNETVMFRWDEDTAPLLYSADRIVAVRSYDLSTVYEEGVDYKLEDGKLVRLEGSRIPCADESKFYTESGSSMKGYVNLNGEIVPLYAGDNMLRKWQIAVTYTHSDEWAGPVVESQASTQYADFIAKLENGEDVTIFFYGDSITVGANASGLANRAPYTPTWSRMFCQYLAKQYEYTVEYISLDYSKSTTSPDVYGNKGKIRYVNTAMGGNTSVNGINDFESRNADFINQYGCDLAVIAFGMNDLGATASQHAGYIKRLADLFLAKAPDADILLISTMEPNPDLVLGPGESNCANSTQRTFEPALLELAQEYNSKGVNCAVAPMSTMSQYINGVKRYRDSTGNHLNHPNDFMVRVYAQTVYQTVIGFDN